MNLILESEENSAFLKFIVLIERHRLSHDLTEWETWWRVDPGKLIFGWGLSSEHMKWKLTILSYLSPHYNLSVKLLVSLSRVGKTIYVLSDLLGEMLQECKCGLKSGCNPEQKENWTFSYWMPQLVRRLIFIGRREARSTLHTAGREGGRGMYHVRGEREQQQRMLATNLNLYWSLGVSKHAILSLVGDSVWMLCSCVETLAYIPEPVPYVNEWRYDIKHHLPPGWLRTTSHSVFWWRNLVTRLLRPRHRVFVVVRGSKLG